MKKLTFEEIIKRAREVHSDKYDYSKTEYTKAKEKVCIICPKHGVFFQNIYNHLNGHGCPKCAKEKKSNLNTLTTEIFIKKVKIIHNNKYDYSKVEYKNSQTKVCIICPQHGEFWQTPSMHLCGQGCPTCAGIVRKDTKQFVNEARKVHGDRYDYSKVEYVNNRTKVCIICPIHGEFWQSPKHHLKGKGCPMCNGKFKKTFEEFVSTMRNVHGDKYDYSKAIYKDNKTKVCIICSEHGEFCMRPDAHIQGQGCPYCNSSRLEEELKQSLNENKIKYYQQYTWEWLKYKKSLRVDFYLPDYNIAIECQGRQHFVPDEFFGGIDNFKTRKEIDYKKYFLCQENGVNMLYLTNNKECSDMNYVIADNNFGFYNKNNLFFDKIDLLTKIKEKNLDIIK